MCLIFESIFKLRDSKKRSHKLHKKIDHVISCLVSFMRIFLSRFSSEIHISSVSSIFSNAIESQFFLAIHMSWSRAQFICSFLSLYNSSYAKLCACEHVIVVVVVILIVVFFVCRSQFILVDRKLWWMRVERRCHCANKLKLTKLLWIWFKFWSLLFSVSTVRFFMHPLLGSVLFFWFVVFCVTSRTPILDTIHSHLDSLLSFFKCSELDRNNIVLGEHCRGGLGIWKGSKCYLFELEIMQKDVLVLCNGSRSYLFKLFDKKTVHLEVAYKWHNQINGNKYTHFRFKFDGWVFILDRVKCI